MSGETWTEYAVHVPKFGGGDYFIHYGSADAARADLYHYPSGTVVGRTVTATPWLPVEDTAVKP